MPRSSVVFVRLKNDLPSYPKDGTPGSRFIMSRDVSQQGAKEFAAFTSVDTAMTFASKTDRKHCNEVLENADSPIRMFFDIDRQDKHFSPESVARSFLQAVNMFLRDVVDVDVPPLEPGATCQIADATAPSRDKTSLHVVASLVIADMSTHRKLACALDTFILREKARFPELLQSDANSTIVDVAVYTRFRSFRMLGMHKLGKNGDTALRPILGSSSARKQHLVGVYCGSGALRNHGRELDLRRVLALAPSVAPKRVSHSRQECTHDLHTLISCERASDEELAQADEARQLIAKIAAWRATRYDPWVRVGFALFNTSPTLLDAWLAFSQMAGRHAYDADGCRSLWRRLGASADTRDPARTLGLVSLKKWADEDNNPESQCTRIVRAPPLGPDSVPSSSTLDHDAVFWDTLHTQERAVAWDDDHSSEGMQCMKPLPTRDGLVCVRANMGIGKTKALVQALGKLPAGDAILVVTFGIALANKLTDDLNGHGLRFTNYQDVLRPNRLTQERLVVCLDSLWRVPEQTFAVVVLDEAVSLFEHFDSPHMSKRSGHTCLHLEVLLMRARTTYLLDASLDCTIIKGVVDHFQLRGGKKVYWVRDKFVRPTNRRLYIYRADSGLPGSLKANGLLRAAIMKTIALLREGKRIVFTSSTASAVRSLESIVGQALSDRDPPVKMLTYTQQSRGTSDEATGHSVALAWDGLDLLAYSPTITAGISYEGENFDCLVGYHVNSPMTAPVQTTIQQLYRVRQLADGKMFLFLHDVPPPKRPLTAASVASALQNDLAMVERTLGTMRFQQAALRTLSAGGQHTQYDMGCMSWPILVGLVSMHNRSRMRYTDLLQNTLIEDYGVLIESHATDDSCDDLAVARVFSELADDPGTRSVPLHDANIDLAPEVVEDILQQPKAYDARDRAGANLLQVCKLWGIEVDRIDNEAYATHVQCTPAKASARFHRACRFCRVKQFTLHQNRKMIREERTHSLQSALDPNFALFNEHHEHLLLLGQEVLEQVLTREGVVELCAFGEPQAETSSVENAVEVFLQGLSGAQRERALKAFGLGNDAAQRKGVSLFRTMMREAFGVYVPAIAGQNRVTLSNSELKTFVARYEPTARCLRPVIQMAK